MIKIKEGYIKHWNLKTYSLSWDGKTIAVCQNLSGYVDILSTLLAMRSKEGIPKHYTMIEAEDACPLLEEAKELLLDLRRKRAQADFDPRPRRKSLHSRLN